MEASNEVVAAVVQPFYDSINKRDPEAVAALMADGDGTLFVGTDGDQWWVGHGLVAGGLRGEIDEMVPGIEIVGGDAVAYRTGDVAWFADRPAFRLPDGTELPTRLTGVAVRDGAAWRVVQGHISMGAGG